MKKLLAIVLAVVLTITTLTACAEPTEALTSVYLNLGEKYLIDLDYEEAIVYFNKVIEVEPKNARAYLGSAEAYVAMGDIDSAIAILEQGIETVDDPTELQAMLAELLGENEAEEEEPENEVVQEEQEESFEITAEDIGAAINEASLFAWNWFWDNQHTDKTDTIWAPYEGEYYTYERVSEDGITTVDDVLALIKQYFTADIAESLVEYKEWIEQDDVLYVSATEGIGDPDIPNYYEIYIEKTSDTLYNVTLYKCFDEEEKYQSEFTYSYVDGYWVFDTILYSYAEVPVYVLTELNDTETDESEEEETTETTSPRYLGYASSDIVNASVEGSALIDGVKDRAYEDATALEFVQKGAVFGGDVLGEPAGRAYIVNDSEYVYVWFEVYDRSLDQWSANTYEQDSVMFYWMDDNQSYQIRVRYDGLITVDSGSDWADEGAEFVAVITDSGYAVEGRFPITDVEDNRIEMCLQINACSDGSRDYTCFILGNSYGDYAYMRTSRSSEYNVWWTLSLDGEIEDTRG